MDGLVALECGYCYCQFSHIHSGHDQAQSLKIPWVRGTRRFKWLNMCNFSKQSVPKYMQAGLRCVWLDGGYRCTNNIVVAVRTFGLV